ncbi:MAG: DUF1294 domain-containing protein [Clostridia bacterium]|nr:DUF1294 domain-containing protein [Clostridia bacterium]
MGIFLTYFAVVSIAAIVLTVSDKWCARRKRQRVPETVLFLTAILGGSAAMYLTMLLIRHKTLHKRFMLGLPAILLGQLALYITKNPFG